MKTLAQVSIAPLFAVALVGARSARCEEEAQPPSHQVEPISESLAEEYGLDTSFYKKHTRVQGVEIVSSDGVLDSTHLEAAFLIEIMMKDLDPEIVQRIRNAGMLCIIFGREEPASDIPEFKTDRTGKDLDYYNWRTRGQNTRRRGRHIVTCGEEDILELEGGMRKESIFIHEFAHAIHGVGLDKAFNERLRKTFDEATSKGLWQDARAAQRFRRVGSAEPVGLLDALVEAFPEDSRAFFRACFEDGRILVNGEKSEADARVTKDDKVLIVFDGPKTAYAGRNRSEYWAEGVQSWFDTNRVHDHDHNHVDTREELKQYDPGLAGLCEEIFGEEAWRFVSPRERAGQGHLEGYDPATAPKFEESDELKTAANDYYDRYWKDYREALKRKYGGPASVLGDHMVLQRDKPVPIWGEAEADQKITVTFAGQGKTTTADDAGQWLVRLDPLEASTESRELTIRSAAGALAFKDVLVGDVWIAGGQSNMGRDVNRSWRPDDQRMDYPPIRFLKVASRGSKYPGTELKLPPPPESPRNKRVTAPNRWHVCTDRTTPECCAVGFFFAERIYNETGIPQGLLWNAWAGSTAREWIPQSGWSLRPELAETAQAVDSWYPSTKTGREAYREAVGEIDAWRRKAEEAVKQGHPFPYPQPMLPEPDDSQGKGRGTTILYNGRVHPLVPYAIAGILWYQGESDYANRGYVPQIEAMVESWRRLFAAPGEKPADLPFYFVQMQRSGSYMSPSIRDQQFQSYFTIRNSGMAVLMDLDVQLHPGNKYDAGRRLALWALAKDYGKDVVYSGPLYRSHRVEGDKVVIEFAYTHGGLFIGKKNRLEPVEKLPDGELVNLEITGDGRDWVPAESKIDGEKLLVWAEGVDRPTDVRYCWKSKADEPFLYNKAGLPAAQFNTTTEYKVGK